MKAGPDLASVKADPGQLEQVILNLAVNARDAMPRGGLLRIETANVVVDEAHAREHEGVKAGRYVTLAVTDTGPGLDAAACERVFEPFFWTTARGEVAGLGLSMVYGIVRQSGGDIKVESDIGRGTTFRVYLPRADEASARAAAAQAHPASSRGAETVLLVEDESGVRKLVHEVLRRNGFQVLDAKNGTDALAVAELHLAPIDVIVTDVVMPGMSGRELVERLEPRRPEMKVIFMSGYTEDEAIREGVRSAKTAFLPKPFTAETLLLTVRSVLAAPLRG